MEKRFRSLVLVVLAAALVPRVYPAIHRSLWTDELTTLRVTRLGWGDISDDRLSRGHFPTYFWALRAVTHAFGESHLALRGLSVLASLMTAALLMVYVRPWAGPGAALTAGALYALHQRGIWAAAEARPYGVAICFLAGAQVFLYRLVAHPAPARALIYVLCCLGAVSMHVAAIPVVLFHSLFVAARWRALPAAGKSTRVILAASVGLTFLFSLAALGWLLGGAGAPVSREKDSLGLPFLLNAFSQVFIGEHEYLGGSSLRHIGLVLGLCAVAGAVTARQRRKVEGLGLDLTLFWLISSLVMIGIMAASGRMGETYRYFSPLAPAASALAGAAIVRGFGTRLRLVFGALLFAIVGSTGIAYALHPGDRLDEAVRTIQREARPGEVVFVCDNGLADLIFEYYGPVGAPTIRVDRAETDAGRLRDLVRSRAAATPGFWLYLYKPKKSPLLAVARALTDSFAETEEQRIGEVRLHRFARRR